ncbi:MAG TPA: histidine kinase [Holophaga sp.]|nr:histidine kinase [Holophaga sp.]HPS66935.1 histidine kinase [Holophaga sp.]
MRAAAFPAYTLRKFRIPSTWGAILVYGMAWALGRMLFRAPDLLTPAGEFLVPFFFVAAQIALGPLPWLWTGDDRPGTRFGRGILQAIPWNLAWIVAVAWLCLAAGLGPDWAHAGARYHHHRFPFHPVWGFISLNFPLALILGWFLADKERAEASGRELKTLADQAQAQALQAQLNPHVLFNMLSGLTELVHEDADAAEEALVGLTELYRQLTTHGSALRVPLRDERNLIARYLELEEIRLGERLAQEWEWPPWADGLELPPLLLQPLVENAIKHGISPSPEGGILRVSVQRDQERLILAVANTGKPLPEIRTEGTGLGNLRQRLALLPEFAPILELEQVGGWTRARLTLAWRWTA